MGEHAPARRGDLQIYGVLSERIQRKDTGLELARAVMDALAVSIDGTRTLSGREGAEPGRLAESAAVARRLRVFAHGHHDVVSPDVNRVTLVDGPAEDCVKLKRADITSLPLAGTECVELWAYGSAAFGRDLTEAGVPNEPEDLASFS